MPAVETSWGEGPLYLPGGPDWDEREERFIDQEHYAGTFWLAYCLRHDEASDWHDSELACEADARSPDSFCEACRHEWTAWLARQPAIPPSDLDADRAADAREERLLDEEMQSIEDRQRW